jgi:trehalose utilization protein
MAYGLHRGFKSLLMCMKKKKRSETSVYWGCKILIWWNHKPHLIYVKDRGLARFLEKVFKQLQLNPLVEEHYKEIEE